MKKPHLKTSSFASYVVLILGSVALAVVLKSNFPAVKNLNPNPSQSVIRHQLAIQQGRKYLLDIDQQKMGVPRDTDIYRFKGKFLNLPVEFSNLTNDTLRYLTMTCSWAYAST